MNYIVDDSLKTVKLKIIKRSILSIWRNNANSHRILFGLFVLTVNLNLYCSSEAFEVRAIHLNCVYLMSVNYAHCDFCAKWSRVNFGGTRRRNKEVLI